MDNNKCDRLDTCAFFQEFRGNTKVVEEAWITSFCDDIISSNECKRKQYFKAHGVAPVANMSPTGRML